MNNYLTVSSGVSLVKAGACLFVFLLVVRTSKRKKISNKLSVRTALTGRVKKRECEVQMSDPGPRARSLSNAFNIKIFRTIGSLFTIAFAADVTVFVIA